MHKILLSNLLICIYAPLVGCFHSDDAGPVKTGTAARVATEVAEAKPTRRAGSDQARRRVVKQPELEPRFDEKDMLRPVNQFREYSIEDYRKLPNCLAVFGECLAVPFDSKTDVQYKTAVSEVAQRPCRVVLKVVDVSADYDFADFELLTDDGESGLALLEQGGDLGGYNENLRKHFAINDIKSKGLDSKNVSIGDRVVLVGLGSIVAASPWGASFPKHGMPKGDRRYVMLRAFGKPNRHNPRDYEFAFMVRNWFIASQ